MKILWTVNTIFPYPSKSLGIKTSIFGGWLLGLYNKIKNYENIELCIITTYNGKTLKKFVDKNTIYYLIPCLDASKENKKLKKYCEIICKSFKPDLVHIHGTEYVYGKIFQSIFDNRKIIVSIQGLTSVCANYALANLKINDIKKNPTMRNFITGNVIKAQNDLYKRGNIEQQIIKDASIIIGRTTFDYSYTTEFLNDKKYYMCNESLRDVFYNKEWNIEKIERHSIYISQGGNPIKGLHIMLEALNLLKNKYSDIKLYIVGKNIFEFNNLIDYIKYSNYQKIISKMIKKYNLYDYIEYTGFLTDEEVANKLTKCHLYVQASSIENSSNALGEAMLVGMPCVASYVGGTPDMIVNNEEGLLYPFGDYGLLAHYISKIFDNDKLAIMLGENAKKHAMITHDRDINVQRMIEIYEEVVKGWEKI